MIAGVIDSTLIIHLYRGDRNAFAWLRPQANLGVTPITWMEIIYGARGNRGQEESLKLLRRFELAYLTQDDQSWAMEQLSVCHRLQVPLYTHNIKDMTRILDPSLVIKPY